MFSLKASVTNANLIQNYIQEFRCDSLSKVIYQEVNLSFKKEMYKTRIVSQKIYKKKIKSGKQTFISCSFQLPLHKKFSGSKYFIQKMKVFIHTCSF